MTARVRFAFIGLAAIAGSAFAGQDSDQQLIDQARRTQSEMRPVQPAPAPQAQAAPADAASAPRPARMAGETDAGGDDLALEEQAVRADVALAHARLNLVHARRALQRSDNVAAARHAQRALLQLAELPAARSDVELELQAEGVLAKARKAGVDVDLIARQEQAAAAAGKPDAADHLPAGDDALDREVAAAAELGRRYDGPAVPELNSNPDPTDLRQLTLQSQLPEPDGYRPGRAIVDEAALDATERQRRAYQGVLDKVIDDSQVRELVAADEAQVAPRGEITYPADWPERVARRAQYEGGQIARSESWKDASGTEWYAAVYDVSDLTYVPPNFESGFVFDAANSLRDWQDRIALRERSWIFGGSASELAAGLPLLHYFGGVGGYQGYYSPQQQEQLAEMVRSFAGQHPDSKVVSLPPINP